MKEWGRKGSGPGEISEPHTIAMDSRGRLFVGDRENNRIQIFDQEGTFIAEWRQFGRPSGISITADDTIYVADSVLHALDKKTGKRLATVALPAPGQYGMMTYLHEGRQYIVVQIMSANHPGSLVALRLP